MKKYKYLFFLPLFLAIGVCGQSIPPPQGISEETVEEYTEEIESPSEETSSIQTPTREERGPIYYEQKKIDPNFKNEYKGEKFNYDRVVKEKKTKPPKKYKPPVFSLPTGLIQVLMYAILGLIIVFGIYYIFKNAGGFQFGKENKKIKFNASDEKEVEDIENIENNNFAQLIQKAKSEQDHRRAVRYYYLWVLQKLTDNRLIKWNKDKTDYDYFLELGQSPIKDDFSSSTYIYDYIWYGNFQMTEKEFDLAETIFQRTLNKLR